MAGFSHVFQPTTEICRSDSFPLKGKWASEYFKNNNPIVLELGCGKGEYTVGLAEKSLNKNFIGVDIKGARIWRGAKTALENKMNNVAFVRCRIDNICSIFGKNEINEIWITFPDPQPGKAKKRLTSPKFLNYYTNFLQKEGFVNLKTDNTMLHEYTEKIITHNKLNIDKNTANLYNSDISDNILSIKTHYESIFLKQNIAIKYISFQLSGSTLTDLFEDAN
jgi:tRNA (guanine-N7-)-methyltransferase